MIWFQSKPQGLRTKKRTRYSSSLKATILETQKEPMLQFESEGRKKRMPQFKGRQEESPVSHRRFCLFVLFRPSTDSMKPTHMMKASYFTQYVDVNINLIQRHPHIYTENNVQPDVWVLCGPVNLTIKVKQTIIFSISGQFLIDSSFYNCSLRIFLPQGFILILFWMISYTHITKKICTVMYN